MVTSVTAATVRLFKKTGAAALYMRSFSQTAKVSYYTAAISIIMVWSSAQGPDVAPGRGSGNWVHVM